VCTSCEVGSWERRMVRVPHMRLCRVVPWAWCAQATTWCGVGWAYFYHLGPPVQHAEKVWRACLRSQTDAFEKQASRIEPVLISLRSRTNVRLQHLLGCAGESGFWEQLMLVCDTSSGVQINQVFWERKDLTWLLRDYTIYIFDIDCGPWLRATHYEWECLAPVPPTLDPSLGIFLILLNLWSVMCYPGSICLYVPIDHTCTYLLS